MAASWVFVYCLIPFSPFSCRSIHRLLDGFKGQSKALKGKTARHYVSQMSMPQEAVVPEGHM
jgi:hypothetical protein